MVRSILVAAVTTAVATSVAAQTGPYRIAPADILRYHEVTSGVSVVQTPQGDVTSRSEHDASVHVVSSGPGRASAWYAALRLRSVGPNGDQAPSTAALLGRPFQLAVPQRSIAASIVIAATGSVLGAIAGGFLGYHIDRARDVPSEDPGLGGLIFGGLAGSAIGAPLLLYVANDRTGSLGSATLLSAAATVVTASAFWDDGSFFMLAPIVQVGISVAFLH